MSGSGIRIKIKVINSLQTLLLREHPGNLPLNSQLKDSLTNPNIDPDSLSRKTQNTPVS